MSRMMYFRVYPSPIGNLYLVSDNEKMLRIDYDYHKEYVSLKEDKHLKILNEMVFWLDKYFKGENPDIENIIIELNGTDFQKTVWNELRKIPYGKISTYKEIGDKVKGILHKERMSYQAVGNAIHHNPLAIFVPCHRVIGSDGSLKGYAGGLERKRYLLNLEGVKNGLKRK